MIKKILPSIAWAILILYLSSTTSINLPESFWDFISMDKLGHFGIYGIFTFLLLKGFQKSDLKLEQKDVYFALTISILYGIGMEVMQYTFFPGRYFENLDIIANIIGSFTGLLFYKLYLKK